LFLLAAIIGYSRVYVGVHFLSDVVAAAVIGLLSAAVTFVGVN
jgi:membrane-associated phospholipid phosphatase